MSADWALGALIIAGAFLVLGLAGFGNGLVALGLLPLVMSPVTAIVLLTVYTVLATIVIFVPLRADFDPRGMPALLLGSVAGTPLGVWLLAALPVSALNRAIGVVLLAVVLLEWLGVYPGRLPGRGWALGAGVAAGLLGAAVGTPGPPVVLYMASQGWSPRTIKANLQAFFLVNQVVIMLGYWWAGFLTLEMWRYAAVFLVPALLGLLVGMALFARVDQMKFRRIVFALLFASGLLLVVRG
ncbi:MAG TPA: sulfite exporter TauE/SafE family protein [Methylomirabilota bacterium]|nr:sulfite exporter TauE/SafE family protein [Methylomirabilota bacterium]